MLHDIRQSSLIACGQGPQRNVALHIQPSGVEAYTYQGKVRVLREPMCIHLNGAARLFHSWYTVSMIGPVTTHASLLLRLRDESDEAAWREFDERYGELIRGFARRRGLQRADSEDVAQEVMLSLSKALPGFQYDPSKGKFRSYLKTATLRAIFRKKEQKHGEIALGSVEDATRAAEADASVDEAWEVEWQRYHMRIAMRTVELEFNGTDMKAFRMYAVEGKGATETAAALSISTNQVYYAKSQILKRLRGVIERQVTEEG